MKACILTVGKEILIGSITNTNSKYISEKLTDIGMALKIEFVPKQKAWLYENRLIMLWI